MNSPTPFAHANVPAPQFAAAKGFWTLQLDSPFQAAPTQVEILLPEPFDLAKVYPVLYILPVVGQGDAFGYGLIEARKDDIATRYGVICVNPSFTGIPWFSNSATDPRDQQDDYVVKALVPAIDHLYPTVKNPEGRWLAGFSKSGWGAYTLLLRHREVFGYAAAWDTPFMLDSTGDDWGPKGLSQNMGTRETMLKFLPTKLAAENAAWLKSRCRLVLGRGIFWREQVEQMHDHLAHLGIPHRYLSELLFPHRWDTGWFAPEIEALVQIARAPIPPA